MTSSPSNKGGFTLVELLAVITIMAIMVAVSLPALRALQGTALQTAARQVQNDMMLARQYAITYRKATRFGIAVDFNSVRNSNLICRAYTVLQVTNDAVTGVAVGWVPLQDWRFLPEGIVFSEQNDQGNFYNTIDLDPVPPLGTPTTRNLGVAGAEADTWRHFSTTNAMTVFYGGITTNWLLSTVEFRPTGYVAGIQGLAGGIRLTSGTVADPTTRSLIVTDTNNWVIVEYDQYGGRIRIRYRDSYK